MRRLILAATVAVGSFANLAQADWQPAGPIKMMIGFTAGGGADTHARLIAEELEARHGWKIIPEQLTGKGGAVLAAALKEEPADGTSIGMLVSESLAYNMIAAGNSGYSQADFTPLTSTAAGQMGIVALSTKGWQSWDDMIAAARNGETIRFGAMSPKLADLTYLLGQAHGVDFNIVMVRGGKAVMNGLSAGDVDVGWGAGIQNKAVRAGDMVTLASGLDAPLVVSPQAPTLAELGVEFTADTYFMFAAPAGIPKEAREALTEAIAAIVLDEDSKARAFIDQAFGGPLVITGAELESRLAADAAQAEALLKAASK